MDTKPPEPPSEASLAVPASKPSGTLARAVLLVVAADGILSLMDVIIKGLTARHPAVLIAHLRFSLGFVVAAVLFAWMAPGWPSREAIKANSLRSVVIAVTATSFFYALSVLPLADAAALSFLAPVFTALFGAALLKERLDRRIWAALAFGLAGMGVMLAGDVSLAALGGPALLGAAAAVLSAITYALNVVILRQRAQRDPLATIVLFQNLGPALILTLPALLVWQTPSHADLALFAAIAVMGVGGHYMLAKAFSLAEAARLAPVGYVILVWAALFGFLVFGDVPGPATLAGAALIVAGTLLTQRR